MLAFNLKTNHSKVKMFRISEPLQLLKFTHSHAYAYTHKHTYSDLLGHSILYTIVQLRILKTIRKKIEEAKSTRTLYDTILYECAFHSQYMCGMKHLGSSEFHWLNVITFIYIPFVLQITFQNVCSHIFGRIPFWNMFVHYDWRDREIENESESKRQREGRSTWHTVLKSFTHFKCVVWTDFSRVSTLALYECWPFTMLYGCQLGNFVRLQLNQKIWIE